MSQELTVYLQRPEPIRMDELQKTLIEMGINAQVLSDVEEGATSGRLFVTLEPDDEEADTMVDAQMVVLDFNCDSSVVKMSAMPLVQQLQAAAGEETIDRLVAGLKASNQSFYAEYESGRGSAICTLAVGAVAACMHLGQGIIHDGNRDEFFTPASLSTLVARELGDSPEGAAILKVATAG